MEPINTELEFIVDNPKFTTERPFAVYVAPNAKYSPMDPRLSTIKWEPRPVAIKDMRSLSDISLERYGFEYFIHEFPTLSNDNITADKVERYQIETENFLTKKLRAEKVICYDYRVCPQNMFQ